MAMLTQSATLLAHTLREPERSQDELKRLIARHKQREDTLHAATHFLRLTLDALSAHIAVLDSDGVIILVNRAWLAFARENGGVPERVSVGANYLAVCDASSEPEAAQVAAGIRAVQARRTDSISLEYPCHTPAQQRWFNLRVTRLHDEDPVQVVMAHEDITMRRMAQEALVRYTEALERSNADLEQFAYVVSHDLQEPLRTISSFATLLHQQHAGHLGDDAGQLFTFILDGVARMQALIADLLAYARLGRHEPSRQLVKPAALLESTLDSLQTLLDTTGAEVTYDALPAIEADPTHFGLLLQNLVSNAIKFRGAAPPRVHVAAMPVEGNWRFSVRDNGIGIEKAYHTSIFEVFRQLHSRGQYEGTGIGLAICKKIVEHHGGHIWVESEPGEGTTFFFTMPG